MTAPAALTGARYNVIATVDEAGNVQDFVTSGFTPEKQSQLTNWPDRLRLYEHFRDLPTSLRLADLPAFVGASGDFPELMRSDTFLGMPMLHRDVHVGNFFLAGKEQAPEITAEDEEVLVMSASKAAPAIANARTHRDEQCA